MKYIKKENEVIVEAPATLISNGMRIYGYNKQSNETMLLADGYIAYSGSLPLANLDIVDGEIIETPIVYEPTLQDYDDVMEAKLLEVRTARGYTVREPSAYLASSNARWGQDAQDWVAYVDTMMVYGLSLQEDYVTTGVIPDLGEFKAGFPEITWSYGDDSSSATSDTLTDEISE